MAVSGGPDSTALMVLIAGWRERPPVLVVSIDHGLRPEAADEVRIVGENAARLGLPFRAMQASDRYETGNVQEWARRARYRCLVEAARDAGFDTIVTGHHRDDQAETFLLRLARGSGVYGLAAMAEESVIDGIALMRPLLDLPREKLAEIASASGLPIASDPSNADMKYDRVALRALIPELSARGLTAERLAKTAAQMRRAASALDHYTGALLRKNFAADQFGVVRGPVDALADAPEEVSLRALATIVRAAGGAEYFPPLDGVESLREALLNAGEDGMRRTLHGSVVEIRRGELKTQREWGRVGIADLAVTAGTTVIWDGRFRVAVPRLTGELHIGSLGRSGERVGAGDDQEATRCAPGLFRDGTLVALPDGIVPQKAVLLDVLSVECVVGQRLSNERGKDGGSDQP